MLDWWKELPLSTSVPVNADVRVPPEMISAVESFLQEQEVGFTTMIEDVQQSAEAQLLAAPSTGNEAADWFTAYHTPTETNDWVKTLVQQYSSLATLQVAGKTYENRTIYIVKISGKAGSNKPAIVYDGGIHAREWISPAVVQFIMFQLLSGYNHDAEITKMVDAIDWYIVPLLNVDGNEYTHTKDRMWRKTRMPNAGSSCVGTDPCRNAATGWGGQGSSSSPCAEDYHGKKAWDQIEMASYSQTLAKIPNIKGYTNFHSYSQLWMSPFGYTTKLPPTKDYNAQTELGKAAVAAIKKTHGLTYQEGPIATTIYMAAGVINDWVYAELNATLSYAVELRDTGSYGFLLPPAQIIPCGEEIFAAVRVFGNYVITH